MIEDDIVGLLVDTGAYLTVPSLIAQLQLRRMLRVRRWQGLPNPLRLLLRDLGLRVHHEDVVPLLEVGVLGLGLEELVLRLRLRQWRRFSFTWVVWSR